MNAPAVLITGGAGYLGQLIARRYLEATDLDVVLQRRPPARGPLAATGTDSARVHHLPADLTTAEPLRALGAGWRNRITQIAHAAAVTRFDVPRQLAAQVNVAGTEEVLGFARRCPRLQSVALVSTVYASGLRAGRINEQPHDGEPGFANWYEWSKWAAEAALLERYADLPWRILRLATVIADDDPGQVTQYNAFHDTLKLCYHGMLPLLPGHAGTPVYLTTGRFAAEAVVGLMDPRHPAGVYHVAHSRADSLTIDGLLDVVLDQFRTVDEFRRKAIQRPLLADRESFEALVEGVSAFAGSFVTQALRNVLPFGRQLYVDKDVDNSRLRQALGGYRAPDAGELVRGVCERLVTTRWGRRDVGA